MVSFLDWEGTDPVSAAQEAAGAITAARREVEARGIKSFLFQASSPEEFDQRVEFGGVSDVLEEVADKYLGSPDQRARLAAVLRREFVAASTCTDCPPDMKCKCSQGSCTCVPKKESRTKTSISEEARDKAEAAGDTMKGGRYPIRNHKDYTNAIKDWNRTGQPSDVKAWLDKKAEEHGWPKVGEGDKKKTSGTHDGYGTGFSMRPCRTCEATGMLTSGGAPAIFSKGTQKCPNCRGTGEEPRELHAPTEDFTPHQKIHGMDEDYFPEDNKVHGKTSAKGEVAVCPTCRGRGSHVNPSIDAHGLTQEDFDADPDFEEDYRSGVYDVPCVECHGKNVVPQCSANDCNKPAQAKLADPSARDRRDAVGKGHYNACYEHMDDDERESIESDWEYGAELAAERRMGA